MRSLPWSFPLLLLLLFACGGLREDLSRAERCYDDARYQDALTWLRTLEKEAPRMDRPARARYYYLRGMASYRLGRRDDALHYLALAREELSDGQGLEERQRQQMDRALEELTPQDASFRARKADDE
ncbi:MAG: hypothetical protein ACODAU_01710 [Myxococcota bacterium]